MDDGQLRPLPADRTTPPDPTVPIGATRPLVLLYHHRILSRDGQTIHIEELIEALRALGHRVEIAAPAGYATADFGEDAGTVALLKRRLPRSLYAILELGYNVPAFWRLWRLHRRLRPDVLYERYNLHLAAGVLLRRLTGTPLLLEVNAPLAEERARFGGLGLPGLATRLEAWIWRSADVVLAVSENLAATLRRAGVRPERIVVLPNGIAPERFATPDSSAAAKAALGIPDDRTVLGFTGFMREWHGLENVIDILALPQAQALHLLLIGDGPARPALEHQVARLGLGDRVSFTGLVPRDAIGRHLRAIDIALQPRAVAYASPLKLFEYMTAGKAIVAPDQANLREVLEPGVTALLFDPAVPGALAAAILRLAAEPLLRYRLGEQAREAILERGYTWRHNAERIAALAETLLTSA